MSATLETTLTVDEHRSAMDAYISDGKERALALGNRGPLHFDSDGNIHPDIMGVAVFMCWKTSSETLRLSY